MMIGSSQLLAFTTTKNQENSITLSGLLRKIILDLKVIYSRQEYLGGVINCLGVDIEGIRLK